MKAIALISGGLDSALAAYLIKSQGIEILGASFKTSFTNPKIDSLKKSLNIPIRLIDISQEYLSLVESPQFGFGKNLNPCIDCHIFMLKKCVDLLEPENASFVITGEVLGQRLMSQRKKALKLIEKKSGLEGILLRPLSAKLLAETTPEKEGWVNREELLGIAGKGRKEQLALAEKIGLKGYGQPAGGCLLTDPGFSKRLKDLLKHGKNFDLNDVELLKIGRHYRIDENTKLIVGRDRKENERLRQLKKENDLFFTPSGIKGPEAILRPKKISNGNLNLAKKILAYYFSRYNDGELCVKIQDKGIDAEVYLEDKADKDLIENLRI